MSDGLKSRLRRVAGRVRSKAIPRMPWAARNDRLMVDRLRREFDVPGKRLAVVVHLYYEDCWDRIALSLARIPVPFDLYVTLGQHNCDFVPRLADAGVRIEVVIVENRGRDVLPFLLLTPQLRERGYGYGYVLKLHSKRSPYAGEYGRTWFEQTLANLLPPGRAMTDLLSALTDPGTGYVGPAGFVVGLDKWLATNGPAVQSLLVRAVGPDSAYAALEDLERLTFAAGTMFWAPLSSFAPLIDLGLSSDEFEDETGQQDATFAHAVERVLGIVPTVLGLRNYALSPSGLSTRDVGETPAFDDWRTWPAVKSLERP